MVDLDLSVVIISCVGDRIRARATTVVGSAGPVTTDGDVDYHAVITESIGDITTLAGPESDGDPPGIGVGVSTLDILRDLVTVEPPDGDLRIIPEHGENATASRVEGVASASLKIAYGATGVTTARAQALSPKGISHVTLWLGTVFVPVIGTGVGVQLAVWA